MDEQKLARLTDRQKDCLRLVGQGFTSKEIGRLLDLSPSTVDNHVTGAVHAIEAPNRGAAARALLAIEARQNLPRHSAGLAEDAAVSKTSADREVESRGPSGASLLSLPPVGGKRNDLDGTSRSLRILQVAVVAASVAIALTIMVAGLFRTFS